MKNVLILTGSPGRNGNSDILYGEFMKGVPEAGDVKNRPACSRPTIWAKECNNDLQ